VGSALSESLSVRSTERPSAATAAERPHPVSVLPRCFTKSSLLVHLGRRSQLRTDRRSCKRSIDTSMTPFASAVFTLFVTNSPRVIIERPSSLLDFVTAVAAIAAAVGTVSAVLVALYLNLWRERRRRPRLTLSIDPESAEGETWGLKWEDLDFDPGYPPGQPKVLYLRVTNETGRSTAQDVEVLLTERTNEGNLDTPTSLSFEHRSLAWAHVTTEDGRPVTSVSIPSGVTRKIEIAKYGPNTWIDAFVSSHSVRTGGSKEDPLEPLSDNAIFAIPPYSFDHYYDIPEWLTRRMTFVVAARDVDAVTYEAQLDFHVEKKPDEEHETIQIWFDWVGFGLLT
jgi:hypothetical protein